MAELFFVGFAPVQEFQQAFGGVQFHSVVAQVLLVNLDQLVEGQRGDHRGVADSLQLHMPAIFGTFQFDNDQIRTFVDAEQIDSTSAVFPFAELLGNHQRIGCDHVDLSFEEGLEVLPFVEALLGERGPFEGHDVVVFYLVNRHGQVCANRLVVGTSKHIFSLSGPG